LKGAKKFLPDVATLTGSLSRWQELAFVFIAPSK